MGHINTEYAFQNLACDAVTAKKQLNIFAAVFIGTDEKKQIE